MPRRSRVLAEPDAAVAVKLKANPGQLYVIAAGELDRRHVLSQVAYRIRTGRQVAFRPAGAFECSVSSSGKLAPVELVCRYVASGSAAG